MAVKLDLQVVDQLTMPGFGVFDMADVKAVRVQDVDGCCFFGFFALTVGLRRSMASNF